MKSQSTPTRLTKCIQATGRGLRIGKAKKNNLELIGLEEITLEDICIPNKKTVLHNQDNEEEKKKP